jgi:RND family efflux transporter MFP subunit
MRRLTTNLNLSQASAWLVTLALAVVATGFAHDARAKPEAASAAARAALTVTLVQPQRTELAQAVPGNGSIAAWQEAIVGSESSGWRLAEVLVNVGDVVKKGQVLARFASETAQAELAQGRASVAEAEAMLAEAAANAQRARDLQASGALSAQQIQQYFTAEHTAQARLDALRAAARVQQLRLAQAQVQAPDHGVISARSATVGAVVGAGQELFRLIRQGRLEWRAEVAATSLGQIRNGQVVRVAPVGAPPLTGRVRIVAPTVDAATRNGLVYVDLSAAPGAKAGMYARGEFEVGSSSTLTLPQSAVLLRDGFSYVFRLDKDQKVAMVKVGTGRRAGDRVEITAGLDPAAQVVASGVGFLGDGDTVRVVAAPPAAAASR